MMTKRERKKMKNNKNKGRNKKKYFNKNFNDNNVGDQQKKAKPVEKPLEKPILEYLLSEEELKMVQDVDSKLYFPIQTENTLLDNYDQEEAEGEANSHKQEEDDQEAQDEGENSTKETDVKQTDEETAKGTTQDDETSECNNRSDDTRNITKNEDSDSWEVVEKPPNTSTGQDFEVLGTETDDTTHKNKGPSCDEANAIAEEDKNSPSKTEPEVSDAKNEEDSNSSKNGKNSENSENSDSEEETKRKNSDDQIECTEGEEFKRANLDLENYVYYEPVEQNQSLKGLVKANTLEDCLKFFVKSEHLTDEYYCENCNSGEEEVTSKAVRRTLFLKAPRNLIINLKRFKHHMYNVSKDTTRIKFPLRLCLDPYMMKEVDINDEEQLSQMDERKSSNAKPQDVYELYGVV